MNKSTAEKSCKTELIKKSKKQVVETFETQRIAKNGNRLNGSVTVMRLVDDDGKPMAIAATELDIMVCK